MGTTKSQMSATAVQPRSVYSFHMKICGTEKSIRCQSVTKHLGTQNIWLPAWPYTNWLRCAINVLNMEVNLAEYGLCEGTKSRIETNHIYKPQIVFLQATDVYLKIVLITRP